MRRPRSGAMADSESTDSIKALKSFYARRKYSSLSDENNGGSDRSCKRRKHVGLHDTTNAPRASYEHKFNEDECEENPMKIEDEIIRSTAATMNVNIATKTTFHKTTVVCP